MLIAEVYGGLLDARIHRGRVDVDGIELRQDIRLIRDPDARHIYSFVAPLWK